MSELQGREILLGVTGGIACYKAVEVLRGLKRAGAEVSVVMTGHALEFVTPLTFQTLSNRPVATRLFDLDQESRIGHIRLAERAELALVAPCTANLLAKLRAGLADDLLSTVLLATRAPVYLALAMNDNMLRNAATQENLAVLAERGVAVIAPEVGFLAEGKHALGRLAEPEAIVQRVVAHFAAGVAGQAAPAGGGPVLDLRGRRILVTAGPTVEAIDPVRFISNRSSGRMGFALAEVCRDAGAEVTLVHGPVRLPDPPGMAVVPVGSAEEMHRAVLSHQPRQDALLFAAAVADYRASRRSTQKIKRAGRDTLTLELTANPDIAADAGKAKPPGQVLVVFAAESQDLLANAQKKLLAKHADLVVANDITATDAGFDAPTNRVTLIRRQGNEALPPEALPLLSKPEVARRIMQAVAALWAPRASQAAGG
ncbi:MAG: bifunctional phosphopantothenoylcysteine decarboxylase/phosphopantothenate--cysteine ligase CoaBC [Candidatus Lambdaproteobacteria bacterium]|nr:bifunctional phosphopantothenoylcysteine decarboxylase/phosphopantothenate--cysteine ligase CoaBC [Candidatus Lambdaproteobacteria bacterium]